MHVEWPALYYRVGSEHCYMREGRERGNEGPRDRECISCTHACVHVVGVGRSSATDDEDSGGGGGDFQSVCYLCKMHHSLFGTMFTFDSLIPCDAGGKDAR